MCGYAWAMAMLDQPVPHAMSRTRAGGWPAAYVDIDARRHRS
jgi:hypothetical protein